MLLETLFLLGAWMQAPEPPKVLPTRLSKGLLGTWSGREMSTASTAPCHWRGTALLHDSWLLLESYALGGSPRQDQWMLRELPDGSVQGRSFSASGKTRAWQGRVAARGLILETVVETGLVQWRQFYEWSPETIQWRLERQNMKQDWLEVRSATVATASHWAPPPQDASKMQAAKKLPYAWYLGTLHGPELSQQGPTRGSITTRLDLSSWFRSSYQSFLEGTEIYSGEGWIASDKTGAYSLWWFDRYGSQERFNGQMIPGGARVEKRDAQGNLLELHRDVQINEGYEFTIEVFDPTLKRLVPRMTGAYQRSSPPSAVPSSTTAIPGRAVKN